MDAAVLSKLEDIFTLKEKETTALNVFFLMGKYVLSLLPTGFGKNLPKYCNAYSRSWPWGLKNNQFYS